jgi:hypothetical protein
VATGLKLYLVLQPGAFPLTKRKKDGPPIFKIKDEPDARAWMGQHFPVLLVLRMPEGEVQWMEVRDHLKRESAEGKKPVKQIVFAGERFDVMSVRRWRDRALRQGSETDRPWEVERRELLVYREWCPTRSVDLAREFNQLLNAREETSALVCSRRVLEVIATDLCEKMLGRDRGTEELHSILLKLKNQPVLPRDVVTSMMTLKERGNLGAHPHPFTIEQIRGAFLELVTIFRWYREWSDIGA